MGNGHEKQIKEKHLQWIRHISVAEASPAWPPSEAL
jgi:hypothetical protein